MRHLALFFVIGALLHGWMRFTAQAPEARLVVRLSADASGEEIERATHEAILVEQAIAQGDLRADPALRERLLALVRAGGEDRVRTEEELLTEALALGLHRVDPIVRQRLALQGERLLWSSLAPSSPPNESDLRAYLEAHRDRYRARASLSFEHVYLSRLRHGEQLAAEAERLRARLLRGEHALGDPWLLGRMMRDLAPTELEARVGPALAGAIMRLPRGVWSEPLASVYGLHLVRIVELRPERDAELGSHRTQVLEDYLHDRRAEQLTAHLRALGAQHHIVYERSAP